MKETDFSNKFIEKMKDKFPLMWHRKIHGEEMQANIPDYLFCINGAFVAIEFKIQRETIAFQSAHLQAGRLVCIYVKRLRCHNNSD